MNSLPLIFEIDVYLRHMKFFRFLSLAAALVYNIVYFATIAICYYQIYNPPPWMDYSAFSLFISLFLAYNILFDFLSVPTNIAIITKEISMEFFQVMKGSNISPEDDISLHLGDATHVLLTVGFLLNPYNIFYFLYELATGSL
jgi:hypothetical protein